MTKLSQKSDFYTCSPIEFSEAKTPRIDQTEPIPVTIHWTSPIELIAELINLRAFQHISILQLQLLTTIHTFLFSAITEFDLDMAMFTIGCVASSHISLACSLVIFPFEAAAMRPVIFRFMLFCFSFIENEATTCRNCCFESTSWCEYIA